MSERLTDPMEKMVELALVDAGIQFERERNGLDFYLPGTGIYIEVKQFHSDRIGGQMSRAENVIAAQGERAVRFLSEFIAGTSALRQAPADHIEDRDRRAALMPSSPTDQ